MSEKKDGGPAFPLTMEMIGPRPTNDGTESVELVVMPGMSLRDWFAGQAIGAVIRQCAVDLVADKAGHNPEQYFAEKAFAVADAMLAARETKP